jgi:hypothetical protein
MFSTLKEMLSLQEGDVIKANFGKPIRSSGIPVPPGFDRFEVEDVNDSASNIIGIKDGNRKKVSTASPELAKALVDAYNRGGETSFDIQPMKFGSSEQLALDDVGISLTEKPSYWDDFEGSGYAAKRNLNDLSLKRIEKVLGRKIPIMTGEEIYGTSVKPRGPLASVKNMPDDSFVIIKFDDGSKYLAYTREANTYIRTWQKID